jgi:hypothetical protein
MFGQNFTISSKQVADSSINFTKVKRKIKKNGKKMKFFLTIFLPFGKVNKINDLLCRGRKRFGLFDT